MLIFVFVEKIRLEYDDWLESLFFFMWNIFCVVALVRKRGDFEEKFRVFFILF